MSSHIVDAFGDPDESPRTTVLARVAHYLPAVIVVAATARAAEWFVRLPEAVFTVATGLTLGGYIVALLHQGFARICLRCMQEVPADAPVRAQRRRWLLRYFHLSTSWKWAVVILALGAAVVPLRGWVYPQHAPGDGLGGWLVAPVDVAVIASMVSVLVHHRLSPWCPYCPRWDDGGHHEPSPTPDPAGVKSA